MDTGFWTRLHGKLRHAALALGPDRIEELADHAERARTSAALPGRKTRREPPRNRTAKRTRGSRTGERA